jgi:hypothetical protein
MTHPLPVATELVYLHPGEYELHVGLSPTANVTGRLVATDSVAHLAVGLATADGNAVPQPNRNGCHQAASSGLGDSPRWDAAVPLNLEQLPMWIPAATLVQPVVFAP